MVRILETATGAQALARTLHEHELRLRAIERSGQASHTSIDGGAIDIYDEQGQLKGSVGVQPDGGVALVPVNTDPPPTPMPPTVEPVLAGLVIGWDGTWDDADATPTDFALVQVHVGPAADFTPDLSTHVATITAQLGGTVTVAIEGYSPVWARLVAQNTAQITGMPSGAVQGAPRQAVGQDLIDGIISEVKLATDAVTAAKIALGAVTEDAIANNAVTAGKILAGSVTTAHLTALAVTAEKIAALAITSEKIAALAITADKLAVNSVTATKIAAGAIDATHIKAGSLTAEKLALGVDGNVIPDPSFEGPISAQRVAYLPDWIIVNTGNSTPRSVCTDLIVDPNPGKTLLLAELPAVPGQKFWFAADYLVPANSNVESITMWVEWRDQNGNYVEDSRLQLTGTGVVKGGWQRMSGVPDKPAAPNTTRAFIFIGGVVRAGSLSFDNVAARVVLASGFAGARAELSPRGLQLYDNDGSEAVALVTGRPNYLTLSSNGIPVATIDQMGNAGFGDLAVAGNLEVGGDSLTKILNALPRGLVAVDYMATAVTAGSTEYGYIELAFEAEAARMYRVVFDCYADPDVSGGEIVVVLRDGGASTPSISSLQIQSMVRPLSGAGWNRVRLETVRSGYAFGAGLHRLLISFYASAGPAGQTVRMLGGPGYPGLFYIEDIGPYLPETGVYNTGGGTATPPKRTYTKIYQASWSGSYANRSGYNSYYGNQMLQGYVSSTNGMQASLVGFPAALSTDLAGATINKAEIYLYFEHWYNNAGGTAVIKAHKHAARPATFSCDAEAKSVTWARNQGKWVDITSVFDSTLWRGIALDPNNSSATYYGRARGVGETYPPQLKVTYTK
ncbi:hypothetical protein ABTY59_31785 [Streptomyces sp. NPDC096079]|uniref:hypothetical protein n=1 Tax=Streptomyces sp. NPDC096079 TaxID=3155820 RepID=UPI003317682A